MKSAHKAKLLLLFLLLISIVSSSTASAASSITPFSGLSYAVYQTNVTDPTHPSFNSFVYVLKSQVTLENEETGRSLIFDTAKTDELKKLLFVVLGKNEADASSEMKAFVASEINRLSTHSLKVQEVESDNKIEVSFYYNTDSLADCSWVWGLSELEVKGTEFSFCSDEAPGRRIVGISKSQANGLTASARFNILVIDAPQTFRAKLEAGYYRRDKLTPFDKLTQSLSSHGLTYIDPEILEEPAVVPPSPSSVGIRGTSGTTSLNQKFGNAWTNAKNLFAHPIQTITQASDNLFFLRPSNLRHDNPEDEDRIILVWNPVTRPGITGYIIEVAYIAPVTYQQKFDFLPIRNTGVDFYVLNEGTGPGFFQRGIKYTFTIFSYKDVPIPASSDDYEEDKLLVGLRGTTEVIIETKVVNQRMKNLDLYLVQDDGSEIKPDPVTRTIYTHETKFQLKAAGFVVGRDFDIVKGDSCDDYLTTGNTTSSPLVDIDLQNASSMTVSVCQDKGEYIEFSTGELRFIGSAKDGKVVEGNPSPEFAMVKLVHVPDLIFEDYIASDTKGKGPLLAIDVKNIFPTQPLAFSFSKTCTQIRDELQKQIDDDLEKKKNAEVNSVSERMTEYLKDKKNSTTSWTKKQADYFSEQAKFNSVSSILGTGAGRIAGVTVVKAHEFWTGTKEGFSSFISSLEEAQEEAAREFSARGSVLPDDALFMPLSVNQETVYLLPSSAFSGRNEDRHVWYLKSIMVDGKQVPIDALMHTPSTSFELSICQFDAEANQIKLSGAYKGEFSEEDNINDDVIYFANGNNLNLVAVTASYTAELTALGDEVGSPNERAPVVKSLRISKNNGDYEEYVDKHSRGRLLNELDADVPDKIKVNFKAGQDSTSIYQWTLELWKSEPGRGDPCEDTEEDCVRVQTQSGGYLYEENGTPVLYNKAEHGELDFDKLIAHNKSANLINVKSFAFSESTKATTRDEETTLGEALKGVEKVWLRVEICDKKDVKECKDNGWLDSIAYLIYIGKVPETDGCDTSGAECLEGSKCPSTHDLDIKDKTCNINGGNICCIPKAPAVETEGCTTVPECKAILDLEMIDQLYEE